MSGPRVVMIALKDIDRPVISGRDSIDPTKIIELAESIREKTLLEPIIVRPRNGRYEIIAGDRRYLAHEHLGRKEIPSIVKEASDTEVIILRGVENLQREDLSPLEEARLYNTLREQCCMSIHEIVKATGKAERTVVRYLRFWRMPEEFKTAVDQKGVSLGVAEKLIDVEDPQMRLYFLNLAVQNGITVDVAELWVSDYKKSKAGQPLGSGVSLSDSELNPGVEPVYITCQFCHGAVELHQIRQLTLCESCRQQVLKMRSSKS